MRYWIRRRSRKTKEREMAEEMAEHLARRAEALAAAGLAPAEARRQAAIEFGSLPRHQEAAREAWGGAALEAVRRDAGYALRQMRRSPGFAAAIILTLALAVGANTAIFSTLYAVLLRPLPYPQPQRLVTMDTSVSLPEFRALQAKTRKAFAALGARAIGQDFTLERHGPPMDLPTVRVTPAFFAAFGRQPMLGRVFSRADLDAGRRRLVVLSYGLWRSQFGGARNIVGQSLDLSGKLYRVAAVMPAGFLATFGHGRQLWAPLPMTPLLRGNDWEWLMPVGRLAPGVSLGQAQAALRVAQRTLRHPGGDLSQPITLYSLVGMLTSTFRQPLWLLLTAAGLILLIACLNIAGLLLARNTGRRAEMAMRAALGATRGRLLRQLLIDSGVLGVIGCGLGVLLGAWMLAGLRLAGVAARMPRIEGATIGGVSLAFAGALLIATILLFGLLPAWEATRANLHGAARATVAPRRQRRIREVLVAGELALAVALAFGAGLLLRSYAGLTSLPLGFNPHNLLTFSTQLPSGPAGEKPAQMQARENALIAAARRRLQALPGVRAAAAVGWAPLNGLQIESVARPGSRPPAFALANRAGPGLWAALGTHLLAGRDFAATGPSDRRPVVIVSQALATELWPGQDPLGRQLLEPGGATAAYTIVGEAPNLMLFAPIGGYLGGGIDVLAQPAMYFPIVQPAEEAWGSPHFSFLVRTRVPPTGVEPAIRAVFHRLNPTEPLVRMQTMEQRFGSLLASRRLYLGLLVALAALALALVVAGVYGVTQFAAAAR
ncbi:MAG: ABC transporter permease, partial [Terriglobales bacterium]